MFYYQIVHKHYSCFRCSSLTWRPGWSMFGRGRVLVLCTLRGLSVRVKRIKNYEAEIIHAASTMRNREESKHPSITPRLQRLRALGYRQTEQRRGWGSHWGLWEYLRCWLWLMSDWRRNPVCVSFKVLNLTPAVLQ